MGYIFFIVCVQMSFISLVVDFFYLLLPILRYQELYFQIASPVFLSPCYQQKQIAIPQQNKLYLLHFSLFSIQYTITRTCNYDKIIHAP